MHIRKFVGHMAALLLCAACNAETDSDPGSGSSQSNDGYDFTFTCDTPGSSEASVPIFPGTTNCQRAAEFYAETYSCNYVDDFATAEQQICDACGDNSPIPCN